MSPVEAFYSIVGGIALLLGAWATYKQSRAQQRKNTDDKTAAYADRLERRLEKVEKRVEDLEQQVDRDARWKRAAVHFISDFSDWVDDNTEVKPGASPRPDIPAILARDL